MKSQTQVEHELELLESDLSFWRQKLDRAPQDDSPESRTKRQTLGNTICGVEGQIEALKWVLKQ